MVVRTTGKCGWVSSVHDWDFVCLARAFSERDAATEMGLPPALLSEE